MEGEVRSILGEATLLSTEPRTGFGRFRWVVFHCLFRSTCPEQPILSYVRRPFWNIKHLLHRKEEFFRRILLSLDIRTRKYLLISSIIFKHKRHKKIKGGVTSIFSIIIKFDNVLCNIFVNIFYFSKISRSFT